MKKKNQIKHLNVPLYAIQSVLSKNKIPYIVIGGIASSIWGTPRFTADIDIVIDALNVDIKKLIKTVSVQNIIPRIKNVLNFAQKNNVILLVHKSSGINIDISLGLLPFEIDSIRKSKRKRIGNRIIHLPRVEDLIIFKSVAHRLKDLVDIQNIIENNPDFDKKYIFKIVKEFAEVLEKPEILEDLKKIINR